MTSCVAGRIGETANVGNWQNTLFGNFYDPCDETATHRISSGCVHEHVMTWDVCARCAADIERRDALGDRKGCVACMRLHDGDCPVIIAIRALEAA